MKVEQLMTKDVRACRPSHPLNCAAQILWEYDCGIVPIVDEEGLGKVVGTLTDRDICMAAYTQGRNLSEMQVDLAMARKVYSCTPAATLEEAMEKMREAQVGRLPVVDEAGQLLGMISLADIAHAAKAQGAPPGACPRRRDVRSHYWAADCSGLRAAEVAESGAGCGRSGSGVPGARHARGEPWPSGAQATARSSRARRVQRSPDQGWAG